MEVKILCPCGAKYKFDVKPLHGKLPGPVKCPVCGADGTTLGNEVIARNLAATVAASEPAAKPTAIPIAIPVASAPATQPSRSGFVSPTIPKSSRDLQPAPSAQAAPAPVQPAFAAAPAAAIKVIATPTLAPSASAPKLSVQAAHSAPAAVETAPSPPPVPRPAPRESAAALGEPSITRGLIGIAAASFVGLLLWFAITLFLGASFKWFAIGIGALIGWAGHWLAKEKSQNLGIAAAIATGLVMITGVLWSARHEAYQAVNETIDEMWKEKVSYAKEAVAASRTDEELRTFLDKNGLGPSGGTLEDDEDDSPILQVVASASSSIDAKTLADFKKNELPNLRKVAEGKVSKSQFERENRPTLEAAFTVGFIFVRAFKIRMLILIGLAIGAAWKFTAG